MLGLVLLPLPPSAEVTGVHHCFWALRNWRSWLECYIVSPQTHHFSFWDGVSHRTGNLLFWFHWLVSKSLRSACFCLLSIPGVTGTHNCAWLFCLFWRIWTQILTAFPVEPSPQPMLPFSHLIFSMVSTWRRCSHRHLEMCGFQISFLKGPCSCTLDLLPHFAGDEIETRKMEVKFFL